MVVRDTYRRHRVFESVALVALKWAKSISIALDCHGQPAAYLPGISKGPFNDRISALSTLETRHSCPIKHYCAFLRTKMSVALVGLRVAIG